MKNNDFSYIVIIKKTLIVVKTMVLKTFCHNAAVTSWNLGLEFLYNLILFNNTPIQQQETLNYYKCIYQRCLKKIGLIEFSNNQIPHLTIQKY